MTIAVDFGHKQQNKQNKYKNLGSESSFTGRQMALKACLMQPDTWSWVLLIVDFARGTIASIKL